MRPTWHGTNLYIFHKKSIICKKHKFPTATIIVTKSCQDCKLFIAVAAGPAQQPYPLCASYAEAKRKSQPATWYRKPPDMLTASGDGYLSVIKRRKSPGNRTFPRRFFCHLRYNRVKDAEKPYVSPAFSEGGVQKRRTHIWIQMHPPKSEGVQQIRSVFITCFFFHPEG